MLLRSSKNRNDAVLSPLFERSSSSSLLANCENASTGSTPSLFPSNFRLVRFRKGFKPDTSVLLRSRLCPRSSTLTDVELL